MKIALCINEDNRLINFNEGTKIHIYSKNYDEWGLEDTISYAMDEISNVKDMRGEIERIVNMTGNCKTLVAKKISGLCYTVFETSGFEIWEMDASVEEALNSFSLDLNEQTDEQIEKMEILINKGEGIYEINLIETLSKDKNVTSKSLLLPFLKDGRFYKLSVICSHIPPWFDVEFKKMSLEYKSSTSEDGTHIVQIYKKVCTD